MTVIIYHNPRCSKSRATLALIEQRGISPEIVRYLESPPDAAALKRLSRQLGLRAADMVRSGEAEWKQSGLDVKSATEAELFEQMARHPVLIQRPIVVNGDRARIGRPPEAVLAILP